MTDAPLLEPTEAPPDRLGAIWIALGELFERIEAALNEGAYQEDGRIALPLTTLSNLEDAYDIAADLVADYGLHNAAAAQEARHE